MTTMALSFATQVQAELARRNIPSNLYDLPDGWTAVSLWRGLIARTEGHLVWWTTPYLSHRDQPMITYAYHPRSAAQRLSNHYPSARKRYPVPLGLYAEVCATPVVHREWALAVLERAGERMPGAELLRGDSRSR